MAPSRTAFLTPAIRAFTTHLGRIRSNAGNGTLVSGWNGGFNSIHGTHAITLTGDAMLVGGDHTLPRQAFQRFNAAL